VSRFEEGGTAPLAATLICEQLLQPVPGGIGTYVQALLSTLPGQGVTVRSVVAWHRRDHLREAGLDKAQRLLVPRQVLYRAWAGGAGPAAPRGTRLVHAPSLAFPPRDGRPLVVTVHDVLFRTYPNLYPLRAVRFHERALARLPEADLVICPSRATADAVLEAQSGTTRVEVVPMGTDLSPPDPQVVDRVLGARGVNRPYVLWAGTLEPRKNLERTVQGFARAASAGLPAGDPLTLCLVGPRGWSRGGPQELLAGRRDRVRWLGPVSRQELAAFYAGAEAFLFPSLAEGFGLPVLEAMACGTPVVTSDRSALPEVAGDAAVLCDPTDAESIGKALATVLRDPGLAERLSRSGLERARHYTWGRTARETASLYRALVA
jgi:glycosyltransferase involved in cell wall biosynthesis